MLGLLHMQWIQRKKSNMLLSHDGLASQLFLENLSLSSLFSGFSQPMGMNRPVAPINSFSTGPQNVSKMSTPNGQINRFPLEQSGPRSGPPGPMPGPLQQPPFNQPSSGILSGPPAASVGQPFQASSNTNPAFNQIPAQSLYDTSGSVTRQPFGFPANENVLPDQESGMFPTPTNGNYFLYRITR